MVRMLTLLGCAAAVAVAMAVAVPASTNAAGPVATPVATPVAMIAASQSPAVIGIFTMGERVFDVGTLPELGRKSKKKAKKKSRKKSRKKAKKRRSQSGWMHGFRAGYRCQVLQVFWAYVHRWGCKPVVARNQTVLNPSNQYQTARLATMEKAIGETYKLSDHKRSWWGRNGRFVVGGILLLLILSSIRSRRRRRRF